MEEIIREWLEIIWSENVEDIDFSKFKAMQEVGGYKVVAFKNGDEPIGYICFLMIILW